LDPEKNSSRIQGVKKHRIPHPGSGSATLIKTITNNLLLNKISAEFQKLIFIKLTPNKVPTVSFGSEF
jgi:hypothetical protein